MTIKGEELVQNFLDNNNNNNNNKSQQEWSTFLRSASNDNLVKQLLDIIETKHATQLCDNVCEVLFQIVSSSSSSSSGDGSTEVEGPLLECVGFVVQFIPALCWAYFSLLACRQQNNNKWSSSRVEAILLSIYNQVANSDSSSQKSSRIPVLSKPSVYHDPLVTGSNIPEHTNASQHDKTDNLIPVRAATKTLDRITAGSRSSVIKANINKYNEFLSCHFQSSLQSFCRFVIRVSSCGYPLPAEDQVNDTFVSMETQRTLCSYPKVPLNGDVMREMVTTIHYVAYNGDYHVAMAALAHLHRKARYTLCPTAILVSNALRDLVRLACDSECQFEHTRPLNPSNLAYRDVLNVDAMKKGSSQPNEPVPQTTTTTTTTTRPKKPSEPVRENSIESALTNLSPIILFPSSVDTPQTNNVVLTSNNTPAQSTETSTSTVGVNHTGAQFTMSAVNEEVVVEETEEDIAAVEVGEENPTIVIHAHDASDVSSSSDSTPLMTEDTGRSVESVSSSVDGDVVGGGFSYTLVEDVEVEMEEEDVEEDSSSSSAAVQDTQF